MILSSCEEKCKPRAKRHLQEISRVISF